MNSFLFFVQIVLLSQVVLSELPCTGTGYQEFLKSFGKEQKGYTFDGNNYISDYSDVNEDVIEEYVVYFQFDIVI